MTYQDFLSSLVSPITSFVSWFSMVANSLIHNYIFITMLGIVLFISLVWLVYDIIDYFLYSHINDYDDFENKYYDYKLFKEVQKEYYKNFSNSDNINSNNSLNIVSNVNSPLLDKFYVNKKFAVPLRLIDTSSLSNLTDKTLAEYYYYVIGLPQDQALKVAPDSYLDNDKIQALEKFKSNNRNLFPIDTSSLSNLTDKTLAEYYYYVIGLPQDQALKVAPYSYLDNDKIQSLDKYKNNH